MRFVAAAAACIAFLGRPLAAEEPQPIELAIHARAIETPPLKYRLFPPEADLKAGDAASILLRLPWEQTAWMHDVFPTLHEWESRPLDAPEWAASGGVLPANFFSEMKRAAFRRDAHWEYPIGETSSPYFILLPDVQGLRGFLGRGLVARIRYHISRGELDQAREGILVGLANGRHVARTPFYVVQLVALAIHRSMFDATGELISRPDSPNLYWALSTLPDSLIELDRAANLEGSFFALTFPAANDLDRPRDAQEWRKMAVQLIELLEENEELPKQDRPPVGDLTSQIAANWGRLASAAKIVAAWANVARVELPDLLAVPPEKVATMSDEEAAVRWYVARRMEIEQQTAATIMLPPREVLPTFRFRKLRKEMRVLHDKAGTKETGFINRKMVYLSAWSLRRQIEALRIIEAVRDYLAAHDGKLPATLEEIDAVSVPVDPITDQPFVWKVEGDTAVLKAPSLPADALEPDSASDRYNFLEYRLKVN
jgi:hypothetical protein